MGHLGSQRHKSGRWTMLPPRLQALHTHGGMPSPTTQQWAQQLSKEKPLTVLEGRERLRELIPAEALRIAGVTFEGRQELIASLQQGWPFVVLKSSTMTPHAAGTVHACYLEMPLRCQQRALHPAMWG